MVNRNIRWATDIGGTFTDIVIDIDGKLHTKKVLTTPHAPERAVIDGSLEFMQTIGVVPSDIDLFVHGTTLATNAILERNGARTALITTEGFRDILAIGDEGRFDQYDIFIEKPKPLVEREDTYTARERVSSTGEVLLAFDHDALDITIDAIRRSGITSVAVCLMHAYANPDHERLIERRIRQLHPTWHVTLSADVCPEIREFERCSTTVANAYVKPIMAGYLGRLESELKQTGFRCPTFLMTSGGGLTTLEMAAALPIRLVESGPAGGAILAASAATCCEEDHVVAYDMGGTTAKICFVDHQRPHTSRTFEVDRSAHFRKGSGLPLRIPVIDMVEIGTGGGSIAGIDVLQNIQVGPRSAGASPGPACYPKGGTQPTTTDANLILGRLDPKMFAGGTVSLSVAAAKDAVSAVVGQVLACDASAAAFGIVEKVEESVASAVRVHASETGKDLDKYTMIAFGGAAPIHAISVAKKVGIGRVILPPHAGVGSAVGFLLAPLKFEQVRSFYMPLDNFDVGAAQQLLADMAAQAAAVVNQGLVDAAPVIDKGAYARYVGQGHEIYVDFDSIELSESCGPAIREAFESTYLRLFGRIIPNGPIEIITWAVAATGPEPKVASTSAAVVKRPISSANLRSVYDAQTGRYEQVPVFWRESLQAGDEFSGPAILAEHETSLTIPKGFVAYVSSLGYVIAQKVQ